jgi:ribonuclease E
VQVRADGESGSAGKQPPRERSKAGSTPKGAKGSPKQRVEKADAPERQMLINVSAGDECRIAVLHEGRLEELFIERASTQSHVGNIYKGRVTNIEASIQAVFVDFGLPQNGFLHISDVQPPYFPDHAGGTEDVGRKIPRHNRPPIQKCFRRGQEVIVQVSKDGLGTKGPTLTTYVAIPGRFLVMMPGMNRHGVSRKIEDEAERRSMRDMLEQLDLPSGMGFIMRTAGLDRSKRELMRDLHYLMRLWKTVTQRIKHLPPPAELYQESDLVIRTIRDVYTSDFSKIIVDDPATAKKAQEFMQLAMPRSRAVIELHADREPLFHRYGIEEEIEKINMRHVPLPSGGSLVIESTEALVAIDVNSGRFRTSDNPEETALRINLEATGEIARQLRLRDLGGLIVCDFIDLRVDRHKRQVERALRDALKKHKERARILKMSAFGLIEMTRQRQGPSLKRNIYYDCPHCKGSGLVKMPSSVVLDVMRIIQLATHHRQVQKISVTVAADVAFQILNSKRAAINQIEADTGKQVIIHGDAGFTSDQMDYACEDNRGRPVRAVPSLTDAGRATV